MLSTLVKNQTKESIELSNRVVIEVHTASFRSVRGYSIDEIAFWRSEESANPGREILAAVRPGMATIPGLFSSVSALLMLGRVSFGKPGKSTTARTGALPSFGRRRRRL